VSLTNFGLRHHEWACSYGFVRPLGALCLSLLILLASGCSTVNVDRATSKDLLVNVTDRPWTSTVCTSDKKTVYCSSSTSSMPFIDKVISVARIAESNDCVVTLRGHVDREFSTVAVKAIEELKRMSCDNRIAMLNTYGESMHHAIIVGRKIREGKLTMLSCIQN